MSIGLLPVALSLVVPRSPGVPTSTLRGHTRPRKLQEREASIRAT